MKDFLKPFLTNLTIVHNDKYPDSVFYKQDGKMLFELYQDPKNKEERWVWVYYETIWSIFKNRFKLNYDETQAFIKNEVEEHLKLGSVTPVSTNSTFKIRWKSI